MFIFTENLLAKFFWFLLLLYHGTVQKLLFTAMIKNTPIGFLNLSTQSIVLNKKKEYERGNYMLQEKVITTRRQKAMKIIKSISGQVAR